jgi:hypothetical protein
MTGMLGRFSKNNQCHSLHAYKHTRMPHLNDNKKLDTAKQTRKREDAFSPTWFLRRLRAVKIHIRSPNPQGNRDYPRLLSGRIDLCAVGDYCT